MVAGRILQQLGYQVLSAENGLQALEIYRQERDRIDLVILDMLMPGMGGAETFQELKGIDPGVRVLLSSGYSLDGEAQQAMAAGAWGSFKSPTASRCCPIKWRKSSARPEARRATGRFRRHRVHHGFIL